MSFRDTYSAENDASAPMVVDQTIYGIDLFLRCLYDYWQHGGMKYLLARKLSALLKLSAVFAIVIVLFFCIDYKTLAQLSSGKIIDDNGLPASAVLHAPRASFTSVACIGACVLYLLYHAWKTYNHIQQARAIQEFYRRQLDVHSDEDLYWMPWSSVCDRLRSYQRLKWNQEMANQYAQLGVAQHFKAQLENVESDDTFESTTMLTNDNIASMIMRRENYWIAMLADNVLALGKAEQDAYPTPETQSRSATESNEKNTSSEEADGSKDSNDEFAYAFRHHRQQTNRVHDNLFSDVDSPFAAKRTNSNDEDSADSYDDTDDDSSTPFLHRRRRRTRHYGRRVLPNWLAGSWHWQATSDSVWLQIQQLLAPLFVTQCDEQVLYDDDDACTSADCAVMTKPILTRTLQWCLTYALFGFAIDSHTGALRHELALFVENGSTFAERERKRSAQRHAFEAAGEWHRAKVSQPLVAKLIWRFRAMAIIGAVLSPFLLILVVLSFFFEHGDQVRREPAQSLGAREWSNEARWTFRQYNELPHIFEARLARAAVVAKRYSEAFLFSALGEVARCVAFICAAVLFVFLLMGAIGDEEALSMIHFALGRSAFWWMTSLTLCIAAARSMVPSDNALQQEMLWRADTDKTDDREQTTLLPTPKVLCELMSTFTKYYPYSWRDREHTEKVRDRFFCLFTSKWLSYVREVLGIVYTPYLFWFVFPHKADQFLNFFVERTERHAKVGHVCAREHTANANASEV